MAKKRGRKTNPHAKRNHTTRAGRRGEIVAATSQLYEQRKACHGMIEISIDYPLDALAAKGLLCNRETGEPDGDFHQRNVIARDTGAHLAILHRRIHGSAHAIAQDVNRLGRSEPVGETASDVTSEKEYRNLRDTLKEHGRRVLDSTINAAIYCRRLPDPWKRPLAYQRELESIRIGLGALVLLHEKGRNAAAFKKVA